MIKPCYTRFRCVIGLAGAVLVAGCQTYPASQPADVGGTLRDGQGAARGEVTLTASSDGPMMRLTLNGLTPGAQHGMHIHTVGRCDGPEFTTAGGHWNPSSRQHGRDNPAGAHGGDLPNLIVGADGVGRVGHRLSQSVSLQSGGTLLDADGAAVIVHAAADDYRTDPTGNSGARLFCAVLQPVSR